MSKYWWVFWDGDELFINDPMDDTGHFTVDGYDDREYCAKRFTSKKQALAFMTKLKFLSQGLNETLMNVTLCRLVDGHFVYADGPHEGHFVAKRSLYTNQQDKNTRLWEKRIRERM